MSVVGVLSSCQIFRRQPAAKFAHRRRYMPKMCRISGNSLSGKIPEFIGKWNNLDSLRIQASGLEGPIPSSITLLRTLTDLQISDLNGPDTLCPPFISTTSFKNLILRSCNLIGNLPESLSASKVFYIFSIEGHLLPMTPKISLVNEHCLYFTCTKILSSFIDRRSYPIKVCIYTVYCTGSASAGLTSDVPFNPKAWEKAIGDPKKKNFYSHGITQDQNNIAWPRNFIRFNTHQQ